MGMLPSLHFGLDLDLGEATDFAKTAVSKMAGFTERKAS